MYEYFPLEINIYAVENINDRLSNDPAKSDFYRTGIEIYVGSFPDVSGPDFIIDPKDEKAIELFREFATKMAAHYKSLNTQS